MYSLHQIGRDFLGILTSSIICSALQGHHLLFCSHLSKVVSGCLMQIQMQLLAASFLQHSALGLLALWFCQVCWNSSVCCICCPTYQFIACGHPRVYEYAGQQMFSKRMLPESPFEYDGSYQTEHTHNSITTVSCRNPMKLLLTMMYLIKKCLDTLHEFNRAKSLLLLIFVSQDLQKLPPRFQNHSAPKHGPPCKSSKVGSLQQIMK